jgi:hypothetical protein
MRTFCERIVACGICAGAIQAGGRFQHFFHSCLNCCRPAVIFLVWLRLPFMACWAGAVRL